MVVPVAEDWPVELWIDGASCSRSRILSTPAFCSSAAPMAVIAIGTSCTVSLRRVAVTTISLAEVYSWLSSAAGAVVVCCWAKAGVAKNSVSAVAASRSSFFIGCIPLLGRRPAATGHGVAFIANETNAAFFSPSTGIRAGTPQFPAVFLDEIQLSHTRFLQERQMP